MKGRVDEGFESWMFAFPTASKESQTKLSFHQAKPASHNLYHDKNITIGHHKREMCDCTNTCDLVVREADGTVWRSYTSTRPGAKKTNAGKTRHSLQDKMSLTAFKSMG